MTDSKRMYIEKLASDIREIFEISVPIIDMKNVVSKLGGSLVFDNSILISAEDGKLRKHGESFVISINPEQPDIRMNFSIAHEIGHLFMHMGYIIDEDKWNDYYIKRSNEQEYEANEFAMEFLMPKTEYKRVMDMYTEGRIVYTGKIARYFNVSTSTVSNRGVQLGYLLW